MTFPLTSPVPNRKQGFRQILQRHNTLASSTERMKHRGSVAYILPTFLTSHAGRSGSKSASDLRDSAAIDIAKSTRLTYQQDACSDVRTYNYGNYCDKHKHLPATACGGSRDAHTLGADVVQAELQSCSVALAQNPKHGPKDWMTR